MRICEVVKSSSMNRVRECTDCRKYPDDYDDFCRASEVRHFVGF